MKPVAPPIGIAEVPGGFLVSLPPRLALVLSLRASFRKVRAGAEPWTYVVPGPARRLGEWVAEIELHALAERRRRAWSASDAEWGGAAAAPAPRPAQPHFVVTLPKARTAKPLLELLQRLQAGDVLTVEAGRYRLLRSGRPVAAGVAARAIGQRLIVPSCDGLFGPEWSQTYRAPTKEEIDAATHQSRPRRPARRDRRSDDRTQPLPSPVQGRAHRDARPRMPHAGQAHAGRSEGKRQAVVAAGEPAQPRKRSAGR